MPRASSMGRRTPVRHKISTSAAAHRADDFSSPYTAGSINLASAQFKGMYVHNPSRNQYRRFMRVKSPYKKAW